MGSQPRLTEEGAIRVPATVTAKEDKGQGFLQHWGPGVAGEEQEEEGDPGKEKLAFAQGAGGLQMPGGGAHCPGEVGPA